MNLSNFRIKSTLVGLTILAGTVSPASSTLAQSIPIPETAVYAGNDVDSIPMYVCTGIANNSVYPGKHRSNSNTCDISYEGYEHWVFPANFVVLAGPPQLTKYIPSTESSIEYRYYWEPSSNLQPIPGDALPIGFDNGSSLYSCRASYNGATVVGKLTPLKICYFGFGSLELSATSYDVLALSAFGISNIR